MMRPAPMIDLTARPSPEYTYLDFAYELLQAGSSEVTAGLEVLYSNLDRQRQQQSFQAWQTFCKQVCAHHPIRRLLWQDPFTRHAALKPRGYAGDAALMDYLYGWFEPDEDFTALGQQIFDYTTQTAAPKSIRSRLGVLARTIDEVAAGLDRPPRIAAIACGHLREAYFSEAIAEQQIQEFIAIDQDLDALAVVEAAQHPGVTPLHGSVHNIMMHKLSLSNLDLIYAADLYDYLGDPVAISLTRRLVQMLRPGGQLLIANFLPNLSGAGYMEAFGQWHLTYRSQQKLIAVMSQKIPSQFVSMSISMDRHHNIAFLKLIRQS